MKKGIFSKSLSFIFFISLIFLAESASAACDPYWAEYVGGYWDVYKNGVRIFHDSWVDGVTDLYCVCDDLYYVVHDGSTISVYKNNNEISWESASTVGGFAVKGCELYYYYQDPGSIDVYRGGTELSWESADYISDFTEIGGQMYYYFQDSSLINVYREDTEISWETANKICAFRDIGGIPYYYYQDSGSIDIYRGNTKLSWQSADQIYGFRELNGNLYYVYQGGTMIQVYREGTELSWENADEVYDFRCDATNIYYIYRDGDTYYIYRNDELIDWQTGDPGPSCPTCGPCTTYAELGTCNCSTGNWEDTGNYQCVSGVRQKEQRRISASCAYEYQWVNAPCPLGEICYGAGLCCANDCSPSGFTECIAEFPFSISYRECGNYDADACTEWQTVSCGGFLPFCIGGICIECSCGAWVDAGCGQGSCAANQQLQTRSCSPATCDLESRCVDDPSCCDCLGGACCDGCFFEPSGTVCGTETQTVCSGASCGDDVISEIRDIACTGNDASCPAIGSGAWGFDSVINPCSLTQKCTFPPPQCTDAPVECVIACNNDFGCDDSEDCTNDVCVNPGLLTSFCTNNPVADGTVCPDEGDNCTDDVCSSGVCTHPSVANDCGARECGPSPSGCFDCGSCPVDKPVCELGAGVCEPVVFISFQIVSFRLDPNPVRVDYGSPVEAVVEVVNLGEGIASAMIEIKVADLGGEQKALTIPPDVATETLLNVGSVPKQTTALGFGVGGWQPDNYAVTATVSQVGVAEPDSEKTKYLSVLGAAKPVPVPELTEVLLPLVALSVLAITFFAGKSKSLE